MRFQHGADRLAGGKIGMADDGRRHAGAATPLRLARRGGDEVCFAERAKKRIAGIAVMRLAFDEDAGADRMAALGVGEEIVEQIAVARLVPEMMMASMIGSSGSSGDSRRSASQSGRTGG